MRLFRNESQNPKWNTQRNLSGLSHYADDDTLRYHKARILSAHVVDGGLLFAIVESCAADMHNTSRVFRYVIFSVFGTVIDCPDLENSFKSRKAATQAMWDALNKLNAKAYTLAAIERRKETAVQALEDFAAEIEAMETK